jgi:UDP-N-acetylmuramoyl-L-alanyl-D-glutamate--2,6-diaminopimelate ligase
MKLLDLLKGLDITLLSAGSDPDIIQIAYDSRQVSPGSLFVAVPGLKTDGHLYIAEAIQAGAAAVVAQQDVKGIPPGIALVKAPDSRAVLAQLAARFYGEPSRDVKVVGVTGTNGKTTTTHLIKAIYEEAGWPTAIMGTLYAQAGDYMAEMGHTTPEALEIESFIALCRDQGIKAVAMEVSSHALSQHRVDRIQFHAAVFTNLTQDHLDYHENMENYLMAKLQLFGLVADTADNFCVINHDDPQAAEFVANSPGRAYTYGVQAGAQVRAEDIEISLKGTRFRVNCQGRNFKVEMRLIGMFSVYNALAAIAVALAEGIAPETIIRGLAKVEGIPGRFEKVCSSHDFSVVVDYAHTPDGLENILQTGRELTENRLITVFGCGGDRDRGKRPLMGEIAARYSDFCVVTSDNPRSEEPEDIIAEIVPGLEKVPHSRYAIIADRSEAIRQAIHLARPGDLVIIAGKGHETYQLIKGQRLEFDDRKVAQKVLNELAKA